MLTIFFSQTVLDKIKVSHGQNHGNDLRFEELFQKHKEIISCVGDQESPTNPLGVNTEVNRLKVTAFFFCERESLSLFKFKYFFLCSMNIFVLVGTGTVDSTNPRIRPKKVETGTQLEDMSHDEFPPRKTPPALKQFLRNLRNQMLDGIDLMSSPQYKKQLLDSIELEKQKQIFLKKRVEQLSIGIQRLLDESTGRLKERLEQLDIDTKDATATSVLAEVSQVSF